MADLTEEKATRLKQALEKTKEYRAEINNYLKTFYFPFKVKEGELSKENLQKILLAGIQARGRAKLNVEECKTIISEFNKKVDIEVIKNLEGRKRFEYILKNLTGVYNIGAKIAGVFMRDMVCIHKISPELINYLYQPVDVHIKNILTKRLKIFDEKEIPSSSESFGTSKNQKFQKILSDINTPRIEFDNFWCVGYFFCNNRVACHLCWINEYCQDPYFKGKNLDL